MFLSERFRFSLGRTSEYYFVSRKVKTGYAMFGLAWLLFQLEKSLFTKVFTGLLDSFRVENR
jgi:hypothetical protein